MSSEAIKKIERFSRFGSKLGLDRMTELMTRLGDPQKSLRAIHVAGTNGKGSVCRCLYEGLMANGYKTGLYTSPFIQIFNERIRFDGHDISDEDLNTYTDMVVDKADEMVSEGFESPTEFEIITAVAFMYFAAVSADFVILEVGLGGRGDSTNIIEEPLADVIVSVSYDHMDRLGSTIEEIAAEKAGIIKAGVPVFAGIDIEAAAKVVAREAYKKGCLFTDVTKIVERNVLIGLDGYCFDTDIDGTDYSGVQTGTAGRHQIRNTITALAVIEYLRKSEIITVERTALYAGLKKASEIGRFEIVCREPFIVLDGAHNEAGAAALTETVEEHFYGRRILIIVGLLRDKDAPGILRYLSALTDRFIAVEPDSPRRLSVGELSEEIAMQGGTCVMASSPERAVDIALREKDDFDLILFAGSLYLIGAVRGMLEEKLNKELGNS